MKLLILVLMFGFWNIFLTSLIFGVLCIWAGLELAQRLALKFKELKERYDRTYAEN